MSYQYIPATGYIEVRFDSSDLTYFLSDYLPDEMVAGISDEAWQAEIPWPEGRYTDVEAYELIAIAVDTEDPSRTEAVFLCHGEVQTVQGLRDDEWKISSRSIRLGQPVPSAEKIQTVVVNANSAKIRDYLTALRAWDEARS